jgi:glycosyltransferase involved in cell wall biosynthesis
MHVGLVTGIFPPDIGGPATFIPALGTGLVERGHSVEVVTYSDAARPPGEWPFRVTRIRRASRVRRAQAVAAILRMAVRADVLLVNGLLEATTLANRVARRACAVKLVGDFAWERARNVGLTTQAFVAFQEGEHGVPIPRWQRERNRSLRRATALIVPSQFLRGVVEAWGTGRSVHVIPNGITEDFVRAADVADLDAVRAHHGLPQRFLLYAGRLTNWKGCDTLIRVLPKLSEDVALVIVGGGPERAALGSIAERLRLGERVRFLPPTDRAGMAPLLRVASCLVLNSGYEGHPHVVLEAMAVGTPVIGAAECGTAELVHDGENGLLFEKDNVPQLVAAIARVLDDAALRERLVAGGRATAQRFPWSATLDRTEALLQQLVGRRR